MARRRQSAWQLSRAESRPAERTGSCRHQLGTDSLPPACHWTSLVPAAAAELGSPAMMKEDIVPSLLRSAFKTNWSEGTVEERAGRGACTGVTCVTLAVCVPGSAATFARRMGKHLPSPYSPQRRYRARNFHHHSRIPLRTATWQKSPGRRAPRGAWLL